MFSLQEYQHVHLLWFKKRSFTLVWKPNPPLRSVRCTHLRARADAPSESAMGARCSRSAYAPLLRCLCSAWACGVKPGSTEALARDQWNLSPATMCCGWQRARFGAAQTMHSHKSNLTTSNFYSHTLKKWSQMRPFWSLSRALWHESE